MTKARENFKEIIKKYNFDFDIDLCWLGDHDYKLIAENLETYDEEDYNEENYNIITYIIEDLGMEEKDRDVRIVNGLYTIEVYLENSVEKWLAEHKFM